MASEGDCEDMVAEEEKASVEIDDDDESHKIVPEISVRKELGLSDRQWAP